MEKEILDMLAFGGAFTIAMVCIYILYILKQQNKKGKVEPTVKMAVKVKEPVAEVVEESDDILPLAEEVDEY